MITPRGLCRGATYCVLAVNCFRNFHIKFVWSGVFIYGGTSQELNFLNIDRVHEHLLVFCKFKLDFVKSKCLQTLNLEVTYLDLLKRCSLAYLF